MLRPSMFSEKIGGTIAQNQQSGISNKIALILQGTQGNQDEIAMKEIKITVNKKKVQTLDWLLSRGPIASKNRFKEYLSEGELIQAFKVYRYLCANCAKIFQKILIVEESLANLTGTQTRISTRENPISYLGKITDLFKPSNNCPDTPTRCPYCDELAYLLLSTSMLMGDNRLLADASQHCCCMVEDKASKSIIGQLNNAVASLEKTPLHNQYHQIDSIAGVQFDATQLEFLQHATLEVNLSDNNLTQMQSLAAIAVLRQTQDNLDLPPNKYESRQSFSTFLGNNPSRVQGISLKEKATLESRLASEMHILKTYTEKLIDVRQQVRTATVLLLGDASQVNTQTTSSGKRRAKQTTTAEDNNSLRQQSLVYSLDTKHRMTGACCQIQHFLTPEGDPAFKSDSRQCLHYNKLLMRNIIDNKMKKNKTFFEMKIMNNEQTQAHHWVTKKDQSPKREVQYATQGTGVREGILFQKLEPKEDRQ
ncbi:hypothetical protein FGO68_gene14494 [Halteria grandinella]|uniref:Uncharacterized protein n=1 Tax=Halteria grandinella TaxID=5974 RepID=A0A8J8P488_HALGN|nr:hypothetical protein FGO68_gene14494 [Halteria grandinella]